MCICVCVCVCVSVRLCLSLYVYDMIHMHTLTVANGRQLNNLVDRLHTEGVLTRPIDVLLADQTVAHKYAHSPRGMTEFPRYTATRLMAVSLARRLQDPLRELSGLCAGMGQDILSLRLHPLQEELQRPDLLKVMHRAFINVVNEVGVDINLAADKQHLYGSTVQFVSGLGPRKARELLRVISKNLYVEHRAALLEDPEIRGIMKEVVWYNCAAFLKITKNTETWTKDYKVGQAYDDDNSKGEYVHYAGGPLEGTRIHPESYVYARQMASDAMEEEDDFQCLERALYGDIEIRQGLQKALDEQDLDEYGKLLAQEHLVLKTDTLKQIRKELISPFADTRVLPPGSKVMPWDVDKKGEFMLLTGESERRTNEGTYGTLAPVGLLG